MAVSIGVYIYKFDVYPLHGRESTPFDSEDLKRKPEDVMQDFLAAHQAATVDDEDQRIWYFEKPISNQDNEIDGYIRYGTFGFESDFVDAETKEKKYKRESHHYEDIPLFYQIWIPDDADFGLMLFQSFGGRSCAQKVQQALRNAFLKANPGHRIRFRKLLPGDLKNSKIFNAPVTGFSFVKKKVSGDKFDAHADGSAPSEVEVELSIRARKKGSWGPFGEIDAKKLAKEASEAFLIDETGFDQASAIVRLGNKPRRVSLFGTAIEAGTIDITEDLKFGENGHPTLQSLQKACNSLLNDFCEAIS